jgi:putative peptidoglycan lipid II flippase
LSIGGEYHPIRYQHGAFGPAETVATGNALTAYALGLPAFVLVKILAPGFFARHDTKTPVMVAAGALGANAALTVLLGIALPFAHVGIASATTIAGWINALLLVALLLRRGHFALDQRARRSLPRILAAAIGMGLLLLVLERLLAAPLAGDLFHRVAALAALLLAGLAAFGLLTLLLGGIPWREALARLRRQAA